MVTITEKAKEKLREFSEGEGIGHCCVRIKVTAGGCSGFQNEMEFDDKISDLDEVIEFEEIKIIIDQLSFQYLEDLYIDYASSLLGEGFSLINPNVKSTCGCGNSYSV